MDRCYKCGREIRDAKAVDLELNCMTGIFHKPGTIPESESQGCFKFGPGCWKKAIGKQISAHDDWYEYVPAVCGLTEEERIVQRVPRLVE